MADSGFFPVQDPYLGQSFGGEFQLEQQIGAGGMGTVYRAVQAVTERQVAVKILHRHLYSETLAKRFQQEAQIISKLNHPHIVTVFKYGQHTDGTLYIAMELAEGRDLAWLINAKALLDLRRSVPLMMQIVDAVAYAHDLKIVHRDLKPENIVVARSGRNERVKILDFGIAKIIDTKYIVTKTGMLCGSPPFMAPEQWQQARDLDGRTDIYALGCVFYSMLTGRLPFEADTTPGYMTLHLEGRPVPPIERSEAMAAAPELSNVVLRCMARDRADRYPDAYSLLEALKEIQRTLDSSEAVLAPVLPGAAAWSTPLDDAVPPPDPPGNVPPPRTIGYDERGPRLMEGGPEDSRPATHPTTLAATLPGEGKESITPLRHDARSSEQGAIRSGSLLLTRPTLQSSEDLAHMRRVHWSFVLVGLLMLAFLALSFAYFTWWQKQSPPPGAQRTQSAPRANSAQTSKQLTSTSDTQPKRPTTPPGSHRTGGQRVVH